MNWIDIIMALLSRGACFVDEQGVGGTTNRCALY